MPENRDPMDHRPDAMAPRGRAARRAKASRLSAPPTAQATFEHRANGAAVLSPQASRIHRPTASAH
jgi:hypothetical protein